MATSIMRRSTLQTKVTGQSRPRWRAFQPRLAIRYRVFRRGGTLVAPTGMRRQEREVRS
jgi:hypothetical protein